MNITDLIERQLHIHVHVSIHMYFFQTCNVFHYISLQALKNRVVCRIRAMVVLPVRDLAAQVFKVFLQYTKGTNLKVNMKQT